MSTALTWNPGSVPSTKSRSLQLPITPLPGTSMTSGLHQYLQSYAQTHTQVHANINIITNKNTYL